MILRHIAYRSVATGLATPPAIDALLLDARRFNALQEVTGMLLHDGQRFFQYIEGLPTALDEVMARITRSSLHHGIRIIADDSHSRREFAGWHMGFNPAPATLLQQLENCRWQQVYYDKQVQAPDSHPLRRLSAFLQNASSAPASMLATTKAPS